VSCFNQMSTFSDKFSKKFSNVKIHEYPSSGSRFFPWGRKDRHDDYLCHVLIKCQCFPDKFSKILECQISWKFVQWEWNFFHGDERIDMIICVMFWPNVNVFQTIFLKKILEYKISWKSVQWEPCFSMGTKA